MDDRTDMIISADDRPQSSTGPDDRCAYGTADGEA